MTAWSSAFDCGVARPLVYSKSPSLFKKVHVVPCAHTAPYFSYSVEDLFKFPKSAAVAPKGGKFTSARA